MEYLFKELKNDPLRNGLLEEEKVSFYIATSN